MRCNGLLAPIAKQLVIYQLPESVQLQNNEFHQCQDCKQIYWKGTHYERLQQVIEGVLNSEKAD